MTFPIRGRCARTGEFGIAPSSSSPAVAARCVHAGADPVAALAAPWQRWQPEQEAYLQRALDPTVAPAFGVPGDP